MPKFHITTYLILTQTLFCPNYKASPLVIGPNFKWSLGSKGTCLWSYRVDDRERIRCRQHTSPPKHADSINNAWEETNRDSLLAWKKRQGSECGDFHSHHSCLLKYWSWTYRFSLIFSFVSFPSFFFSNKKNAIAFVENGETKTIGYPPVP